MPDHPRIDPGDGRQECRTCGKRVWRITHSCAGIPATTCPETSPAGLHCHRAAGHDGAHIHHGNGTTAWGWGQPAHQHGD